MLSSLGSPDSLQLGVLSLTDGSLKELGVQGAGPHFVSPGSIVFQRGPIVLVTNLLTEGRGMVGFTAGSAMRRLSDTIGRTIDVIVVNTARPSAATLERYAQEHKAPLEVGDVPNGCEIVSGEFWRGEIARHDRRRLAHAVWAVLARRLL